MRYLVAVPIVIGFAFAALAPSTTTVAIAIAMLLGLIPAFIAESKGEPFFRWWVYGSLLFVAALPIALLMKTGTPSGMKKCPYCAEMIRAEATVCRYCQREQPG